MVAVLNKLFEELGYNDQNGLYVLGAKGELILDNFPYRISRILNDVIKPYAIYSLDNAYDSEEHVKPINTPLILFYNNPSTEDYATIARHSFNLSRSPIVFISNEQTQTYDIYNGFEFSSQNPEWLSKIDVDIISLKIENLRNGRGWKDVFNGHFKKSKTVDKFLLSNITDARRLLVAKEPDFEEGNLRPEIANRLIGRLIFIRYLIDREVSFTDQEILKGDTKPERQANLHSLLLDKEKTYLFFEYINKKFKGDLFPLTETIDDVTHNERDIVSSGNLKVMHYLFTCSNMFVGKEVRGYSVQPSLFNKYDFEIIPVELISNIYESFLGSTEYAKAENIVTRLSKQKQVKAYYTPPFLVDYVLRNTVSKHLSEIDMPSCKVLDPSCGSGIFLVESLRQIIEKEIKGYSSQQSISNDKLWELLKNNIFGIDIDSNAIEVTTFSLYITLLDYKRYPREIEEFQFQPLRTTNLFGGENADFFNTDHKFNKLFQTEVKLDFIIGNPPWGHVSISAYNNYIEDRRKLELSENESLGIKLEIGNKEISQAFMIRVSDLIQNGDTKFCFIVTGKNLYNSQSPAKEWRKYLLTKFRLIECFDLVGVNNKVAGGNQVFENANQPPVIILYQQHLNSKSQVKHIVARANKYYHHFKTIVIEKNDVKMIAQTMLLRDDKLWKILLHGNVLDYQFIKRLEKFPKMSEIMSDSGITYKGGFKAVDNAIPLQKRKNTSHLWDYKYLEVDSLKQLRPYAVQSTITFKEKLIALGLDENLSVAQIPEDKYFTGLKLLIKKGLDADLDHRTVSAVSSENLIFSSTIASIICDTPSEENFDILYSMAAIFNSRLFSYYLLMTSSSFGADRNRANFDEFFNIPFVFDQNLANLSKELHKIKIEMQTNLLLSSDSLEEEIERLVEKTFEIKDIEKSLIDYALDVSLPIYKRADRTGDLPRIFVEIDKNKESVVTDYCNVFFDHFNRRFNTQDSSFNIDVYIQKDFVAVHFLVTSKRDVALQIHYNDTNLNEVVYKLGNLSYQQVSSDLFVRQDIRGFNKTSFYVIKPNEVKNWHKAIAFLDLNEFVGAIAKAELSNITALK